ncbi:hypothetical protein EC973_007959 [Apophysomyces ossiformis]|uniref:PSP1 C-terminal domain-containing protein n=1 Tax=Apophysomyces ossiformis TaxID=679940 RepID=A0A8H7BNN1_9FUNG|nr:hypothetical protein EC973_007959 [Apophysomyces ossiformis]
MSRSNHTTTTLFSNDDGQDDAGSSSVTNSPHSTHWKTFGSPPRRRTSLHPNVSSAIDSRPASSSVDPFTRPQDYAFPPIRRNSAVSTATVDKWATPPPWSTQSSQLFHEDDNWRPPSSSSSSFSDYPDIASVPMLPEVSVEPFFREQRSMSYTVGHDDWPRYVSQQQQLDTMQEEDETLTAMEEEMLLAARFRARSKSSAAAFDIWNPGMDDSRSWMHLANRRRSLAATQQSGLTGYGYNPLYSNMSAGDRERLGSLGRRLSLSPAPDKLRNDNSPLALLNQRRHSLAGPAILLNDSVDTLASGLEDLAIGERPAQLQQQQQNEPLLEGMGKGVRLDALPNDVTFFVIEFKGGRSDIFYSQPGPKRGDLVIVEADRGHDLGKVTLENVSRQQLIMIHEQQLQLQQSEKTDSEEAPKRKDIYVKRIFRLARPDEVAMLMTKSQDEAKALMVCQSKVRAKKLNMQVVDAEYQWYAAIYKVAMILTCVNQGST